MLFFAFQTEPGGFLVEMREFLCELHPRGESFSKCGALASGDARPMEVRECIPPDVPFRVEGPIGRDVDPGAGR